MLFYKLRYYDVKLSGDTVFYIYVAVNKSCEETKTQNVLVQHFLTSRSSLWL